MSIVMGLDQHRGQITGEWIDTDTGEVQRTRVAPADRAHVRSWLSRFRGRELGGCDRGDDWLAVRGRGAAPDRGGGAPGRAGGDR